MKKAYVKIFVTALLALMAALSVFAGCGTESAAVIASVPENATVEVGDDFDFSTAAILCGKTVYRPSQVKITFGDDAENVEFTGDKFTVQKAGKYSIEFNFDVEKKTHTYSTVVTGVDTTAPSIAGGDKLPVRIEKGVATELPEFTAFDLCDGAVATTVKVFELDGSGKKTENEITPQEGKITVNTYNGAVIEVSAKDAAGNPTAEEYKISVRGEREVNYFENTAYALGDMLILGYDLNAELNEDPAYAIEGNNSIKMTVKGWNPRIRLSSVSEVIGTVGKENIKELTFWVYNNADFDCNVSFAQFGENDHPYEIKVGEQWHKVTIIEKAYKKQWTKVTVPMTDAAKYWDIDTTKNYGLYVDAYAYDGNYPFDLYFDCFRLTLKNDADSSFSLNLQDVDETFAQNTPVTVAESTAFENLDTAKLSVTAKDEHNVATAVTKNSDGSYTISPEAAGIYSVSYIYRNGDDIGVFNQKVTLRGSLKDTYVENFENDYTSFVVGTPKANDATVIAEISTEKKRSGNRSLKIYQSKWGCAVFELNPTLLNNIKTDSTLRMWILVTQSRQENGTPVIPKISFRAYKTPESSSWDSCLNGGVVNTTVNVSDNDWYELTVTGESLTKIKNNGKIVFFVEPQEWGNTTYYIDDIEVTEPADVTLNFADKRSAYTANTPIEIAEIAENDWAKYTVSIKGSNGNSVAHKYENGKLQFTPSELDVYTVYYVYRDGHKVASATQTITLYKPLDDPNFDGFEEDGNARVVGVSGSKNNETWVVVDSGTDGIAAHGGNKMYRMQNLWKDRYAVLQLSDEMVAQITDGAIVSVWLRIPRDANNNQVYVNHALFEKSGGSFTVITGTDVGSGDLRNNCGASAGWFKIDIAFDETKASAIQQHKLIGIKINQYGHDSDLPVFYIDDIEVTKKKTDVTMTPGAAKVLTGADGAVANAEIADLTSDKFAGISADKLSVSATGGGYRFDKRQ